MIPTPRDIASRQTPPPRRADDGEAFGGLFARAIGNSALPSNSRLVALTLLGFADWRTGVIADDDHPGLATVARYSGLPSHLIRTCFGSLKAGGWVEQSPPPPGSSPQAANRTVLLIPHRATSRTAVH